ncbi:MAG TPA: hypothetical protein ENI59_01275, partial [Euryarchaeota archaeon]|nr:hypothetical protein [Euryarchaeota archaeon]
IAIHPAFLGRTVGGFADTDAYNVLFPGIIALFLILGISSNKWIKSIIYGGIAGIFQGIYIKAWGAWWYTFDILLVALFAILGVEIARNLYLIIVKKKKEKIISKKEYGVIGVILSFVLLTIIIGLIMGARLSVIYSAPIQAITSIKTLKTPVKADLWPNVYTTVAELNPASISSIISQMGMGSILLFILGLMGIVFLFIDVEKMNTRRIVIIVSSLIWIMILISIRNTVSPLVWIFLLALTIVFPLIEYLTRGEISKERMGIAVLLAIWMIASIYTSTKGTRFTLLLVLPFSIGVASSIAWLYRLFTHYSKQIFGIGKKYVGLGFIVIVLLLFMFPQQIVLGSSPLGQSLLDRATVIAKQEVPSMNDAWYNSLTKIKNNSSRDAIITSWWDFGHWFKAIAQRRVTFDGASQNSPQAHWVGKLLQTSDEEEAIGILRMLDCGANRAFEEINKEENDTLKSIMLLYKIIPLSREEAYSVLEEELGTSAANRIIKLTHCDPPEAFLITSQDMVGKAAVWAHFGLWNFTKAEQVRIVKTYEKEEAISRLMDLGMSREGAVKIYYEIKALPNDDAVNSWVSPWPSYLMNKPIKCSSMNNAINCSVNAAIAKTSNGILVARNIYIDLSNPYNSSIDIAQYANNMLIGSSKEKPVLLVILGNGVERYELNGSLGFSITATRNGEVLISDPLLADSMFTRLFYFNGIDTSHFEKFSDETTVTGERIIIWRVKWS